MDLLFFLFPASYIPQPKDCARESAVKVRPFLYVCVRLWNIFWQIIIIRLWKILFFFIFWFSFSSSFGFDDNADLLLFCFLIITLCKMTQRMSHDFWIWVELINSRLLLLHNFEHTPFFPPTYLLECQNEENTIVSEKTVAIL